MCFEDGSEDVHTLQEMGYFEEDDVAAKFQRHCAVTTIQRAWRRCRYGPKCKMCEKAQHNNLLAIVAVSLTRLANFTCVIAI